MLTPSNPASDREFYKFMSLSGRKYLLNLLNKVLSSEITQKKMILIFKKGQRDNSENYKGISLINTITKIFTSILSERILTWSENNDIMPKCQSRDRRNRGCIDLLIISMFCLRLWGLV